MIVLGACGDETSDGDGSGGSSSQSTGGNPAVTVTGPGATVTTVGTGGSMPMGICMSDVQFDGDVFDGCLDNSCCAEFNPCNADADCAACIASGPTGPGCDTNTLYQTFITCFDTNCAGSLCGTMLGFQQSPNLNVCINANCCAEFNPCELDTDCNTCLGDSMAPGCDTNVLYQALQTCRDTNCSTDMCQTGIRFVSNYYNGSQDTNFVSTGCGNANCCTELQACANPSMQAYPLPMMDPDVAACILCLNSDPSCDPAFEADADAFNACFGTNC